MTLLVIALSGIGIALLAAAISAGIREQRVMARRVSAIAPTTPATMRQTRHRQRGLQRLVARALGPAIWPRPRTIREISLIAYAGATIAGGLGILVSHTFAFAFPAIFVASFLAIARLLARMDQRSVTNAFLTSFPDSLDMLVRNLRIGQPLDVAIKRVASQAPAPVNGIFAEMAEWMRLGVPLATAVSKVGQRIKLREFDFFGASIVIQNKTGGNFIEVSENLAAIIRQRQIAMLRSRAAASHARITARILIAIPLIIVSGFAIFQPSYFMPLFEQRRGWGMLGYAVSSFTVGVWFINRYLKRFLEV